MSQHVSGIGGIFFRSNDPKGLADWYKAHFGINIVGDGIWMQEAGPTVFSPFKADTDYFAGPEQQFMLNIRVHDIDALIADLEAAGVRMDSNRMDESYGRFAWCYDPEGRKIELWQPIGEVPSN